LAGIRSSKLLEILLPNLLINLEGISQEDVFAAIDATTGDCDVTKLQGWRNRIDPEARSAATAFLDAICAGHDSEVLAATVPDLMCSWKWPGRCDLCWICFDVVPAGPMVQGTVLRDAWIHGHHGSILRAYDNEHIIGWFQVASPETLMDDSERIALSNLPDEVLVFRGDSKDNPEQGISWTLDKTVAENFANRIDSNPTIQGIGMLLERRIARKSILALIIERDEAEIIVGG